MLSISFKFRLYPSKSQRTKMNGVLDACRWVHNKTIEVRKEAWQERGESVSYYEAKRLLPVWKAQHEFLNQAHSQSLQDAAMRVDLAFKAFFRRVKLRETPGYPRFKGRDRYNSFTFPQAYATGVKILDNGRIRLSKIGDVKVKMHRDVVGKLKTVTVRQDSVGNWYVTLSCEFEPDFSSLPEPPVESVGVDLGLAKFAVLSNGEVIQRQRFAKRDEKDIARLHRKKEGLPKGSVERRKALRSLQHAYKRQRNRRTDFAHQESRKLVNQYGLIVFEKLNIQDMQSNGKKVINRGIADVAWNQFVQFIAYKAAWAGRGVVLVDPKNTTQMCSGCGEIVKKDLSVRIHDCPYCGLKTDRDHNAALNILARGLASIRHRPVEAQAL